MNVYNKSFAKKMAEMEKTFFQILDEQLAKDGLKIAVVKIPNIRRKGVD